MSQYHMHKSECEIQDPEEVEAILLRGKYATLALCRGQEPYVVTLSYGYDSALRVLYFHSATEGLKLKFIRENPHVSGTVIEDRGYLPGKCAHAYRSVVFSGDIEILDDLASKRVGFGYMIDHLEEDAEALRARLLSDANRPRLSEAIVLKLTIREMTGKAGQ